MRQGMLPIPGPNLPDPSSSRLLKQLLMMRRFSSSNSSALLMSRPLMAMEATGKHSRQASTAARDS
jgi:hypothetical protein